MQKILIVDDDVEIQSHLIQLLTKAGYEVVSASSAKEALEKAGAGEFDVALLDFMMPKMSGLDALPELRRMQPRIKVIMLTAFATIENAIDAVKQGACDYIAKPFKKEALLIAIRRALEEAKFEKGVILMGVDQTLTSISNPIRRDILKLLSVRPTMRLMELTRELKIDDHTKVNFHMKMLKEAGVIEQDADKNYSLTGEGRRTLECLKTIENYVSK